MYLNDLKLEPLENFMEHLNKIAHYSYIKNVTQIKEIFKDGSNVNVKFKLFYI